jgi:hypothetical protein
MTVFAIASAVCVILWAALVAVAQVLNPEQSPLSMGMSGLARGRSPWVMKAAFVVRGLAALLLVAALPSVLAGGGATLAGLVLLWLWGIGSAALAIADTDMPGETPTAAGAAHSLIALITYVAGVAGAIVISLVLRGDEATAGVVRWALPIALAAAVALVVQLVAFWAAARVAQTAAAGPEPLNGGPRIPAVALSSAPPGIPPVLEAPAPTAGGPAPAIGGLAGCAGLLQRIFIGLLMAWTFIVALGI